MADNHLHEPVPVFAHQHGDDEEYYTTMIFNVNGNGMIPTGVGTIGEDYDE
jgi:hypothetical protein